MSIFRCVAGMVDPLVRMATYPVRMGRHPGEMATYPVRMGRHPGEMATYPVRMGRHPGEMATYPVRMGRHPGEMATYPARMHGHPGGTATYPDTPARREVEPDQLFGASHASQAKSVDRWAVVSGAAFEGGMLHPLTWSLMELRCA
jgi:hypothetical protein